MEPDCLESVVAQVQFTPVLSVRDQTFVAPFQEAMRRQYPMLERDVQHKPAQSETAGGQVTDSIVWRLRDVTGIWQVSLAEEFVSLDCGEYSNRADFSRRLAHALEATETHIRPVLTTRVGVRYTNRLAGGALKRIREFIRPELLGMVTPELGSAVVLDQMSQAQFLAEDVTLTGHWGFLPANVSPNPSIGTSDEPSWLLDLDAFRQDMSPFDVLSCVEDADRYASAVYTFFRWAVSDQFLDAHEAVSQSLF